MNSETKGRLISLLEKTFDVRAAAANIGDSATVEIVLTKAHDAREEIFNRRFAMLQEMSGIKKHVDPDVYEEICEAVEGFSLSALKLIAKTEKEAIEAAAVNQLCGLPF